MSVTNVAIVGGGIAGLITAVALSKRYPAMNIDVYEAAHAFGEIGLGIGMWPRTWEVLALLGLEEEFDAIVSGRKSGPDDGNTIELRKSDQKEGESLGSVKRSVARMATFHRQDLQRVLLTVLERNPNCRCHVAHRLVKYIESQEGVDLIFENGATARGELLIGADGIKSVVRSQMLPGHDPVYSGTCTYRGLIPVGKVDLGHVMALKTLALYCGKNKHLVAYLISEGKFMNTVVFMNEPDVAKATAQNEPGFDFRKEFGPVFSGWEQDVQTLVKNLENPIKFPVFELKPLDTFISAQRRVVLTGDAAHAMPPHLGAGAGQAIEDGYMLATLLHRPHQDALEEFDRIRRPWANSILKASQDQGHYYDMNAPEFEEVQEGDVNMASELKELMKGETIRRYSWGWSHAPAVQDI